jgi:hypothetical protein
MILEDATKEAFGYYASELKSKSNKHILAACELCGEFRIARKDGYHTFCKSCIRKGKHLTKEHKANLSAVKRGEKNYNWQGGVKLAWARHAAKRKRHLGYIILIPLAEGEVGHHVTNKHVIGLSKEVHEMLSGGKRREHRAKVLEWLKLNDKNKYSLARLVLLNEKEN